MVATISIVAAIAGTAWWWEKQLPGKLQQAAQEGDLEACLKYGEQLAALRWLGSGAPEEQALCRRRQAEKLWNDGQVSAALKLQTLPAAKPAAKPAHKPAAKPAVEPAPL